MTITAKNTRFGTATQASFGPGVSVGGAPAGGFGPVRAVNEGAIEADVAVVAGASTGARAISIRTGTELANKAEAFTVGAVGVPHSIRLNLTDVVVAPGEASRHGLRRSTPRAI